MLEVIGPSLTLRLPAPEHVPGLFALASDPEVTRRFAWGPYETIDEPRAWIGDALSRRLSGDRLELVVEQRREAIGVTTLMEFSHRDRRAMVGTWFGHEYWGTGVNAESKALVLHLGFHALGMERIGAYTEVAHERSQRALEKLGFVREGVLRHWHRHPDGVHDVVVFGLLRDDWTSDVPVEVRGEPPATFVVG